NRMASTPTLAFDRAPDPELTAEQIQQVVFYVRTLAPPAAGPMTARRQAGETVFAQIGCATCHVPEVRTGPHRVAALADRPVRLYSDLLLHDLGEVLADGVRDADAAAGEWRTAPLWGLRVMRDFLDGEAFLLHDGRARSVEEAILLHGGEAQNARDRFAALPAEARAALLDFVESR
ncbi:MAG: di-heme oxidoredictase family protein, partial [Longimicrobiales bacterium]